MKKLDGAFITYAAGILGDTNHGLSGNEILKYCSKYAIEYNTSLTFACYPFEPRTTNKRSALAANLNCFNDVQQFEIIKSLCELPMFSKNEEVKKLKVLLFSRYGSLSETKITQTELVIKTKHWLGKYPKSLEVYSSALDKYEANIYERNCLDDMRLAFELLVRELFNNDKSLENQISEIGQNLKTKDTSKELTNMIVKIINYYTTYQNEYIKHDDLVNENEIEYIIELTSLQMKFLIKMLG